MLEKLLKEIMVLIAGKQAEPIVDLLDGKKYINEFIIAKKLDLTINQTRNILYKISDQGLVSFMRKKDKRKGWYTYFWKIEISKCLEFLRTLLLKKMDQLSHQIKSRETKEFYSCEKCNIEFTEETALLHDFVCNECGEIVTRKENTSILKEYNRELEKLKKELALVDEELKIERDKLEKTKLKEMKKNEKIKEEEKAKKKVISAKKRADNREAKKKLEGKETTDKGSKTKNPKKAKKK